MNESTEFLLTNIDKTLDVCNSVILMEREVLKELDDAIRNNYRDWLTGEWVDADHETLCDDNAIGVFRREWALQDEKDNTCAFIWPYLYLDGEEPFWCLFGKPVNGNKNTAKLVLLLSIHFKQLNDYKSLIREFDKQNKELLTSGGFESKGGDTNRYYEMPILFTNTALLKGLRDGDWDDALKSLKEGWQLFEKVRWDFLVNPIRQYKAK